MSRSVKLVVALGFLAAFLLGGGAMLGLVEGGVIEVGEQDRDSGQVTTGGGGLEEEPEATAPEVRDCLKRARGVRSAALNGRTPDLFAGEAPGGVVVVDWSRNRANISFWRSEQDAENVLVDYEAFAKANRRSQEGRLFRGGSVVTAYKQTPTEAERDAVARCL